MKVPLSGCRLSIICQPQELRPNYITIPAMAAMGKKMMLVRMERKIIFTIKSVSGYFATLYVR
jgi:hypothetical protein